MNEILEKKKLSDDVYSMTFKAPRIAAERKAGQFLIIQLDTSVGERIPLTIADADPVLGTISIVFRRWARLRTALLPWKSGKR